MENANYLKFQNGCQHTTAYLSIHLFIDCFLEFDFWSHKYDYKSFLKYIKYQITEIEAKMGSK